MKSLNCCVLLAATLCASALAAQPTIEGQKPVLEGKWLGEAGFPADRVTFALEFRAQGNGPLGLYLTQPVMNFFGLEVPGAYTLESNALTIEVFGLTGTLAGDTIEGTMTSLKIPFILHRTDSLPSEDPIPDLPRGPEPFWTQKLGAPVYAQPVIDHGVVYTGTTGGIFQAVNIADGSFAWVFPAGAPIFGAARITDDAVYFACDNGYLFRLNRATGEEVWRYDLGDAQSPRSLGHQHVFEYDCRSPRPLLVNDTLYVGAGDGSFHAVAADTGARVWRIETSAKIRGDATTDGTRIFIGSTDNHMYALDPATGGILWNKDTRGEIRSGAPLIDGRLIVGTRGSALLALDPATGEPVWKQIFWGSWVESEPVLIDGLMYIGASDMRRAACYDPADGRVLWRTDVFGWNWGTPAARGDRLYIAAAGVDPYVIRHVGGLLALDRATGRILWRNPVRADPGAMHTGYASGPVIEGDTLIVAGLDGLLAAYRLDQ